MKNKRKEKKRKKKKRKRKKKKPSQERGEEGKTENGKTKKSSNTELKILSFRQTCPLKPQFKATKSQLEKLFRKIKIREN